MCFASKFKMAQAYLAMMDELLSVVIQDAAAMLLECPDCAYYGLFQLPVFQSQAFTDYDMNGMKHHLEISQAPYKAQIDQVLPGVHWRMGGMGSNINYVRQKVIKHNKMQMEAMSFTISEVLHFL